LRVSARGYRAWASRPARERQRTDSKLLAHIHEHDALSNAPYGRPRVILELRKAGLDVGEQRVGRLMKDNGIRPVRTRRHKVATGSQRQLGVAPNLLDGDFLTAARNLKWAGDISYIWTTEGWLYPAVAIDLFSRRVVGWVVYDRMKKDLAVRVLEMAVNLRQPPKGCIFHSGRGSQYRSYDFQKKPQAHGLRPSLRGKRNCYGNAAVETFFKSLKARGALASNLVNQSAIFRYTKRLL
jgi:putative transposase